MSAMDLLPRVPMSTLARACDSFSPAAQIGSGATGAVFRGLLDGAAVALKRLNVPEGASPDARRLIDRAFHAELWSLAAYSSPRLVRLLCYAIDEDAASRFPFVLAFELLEGGSLADRLRGPGGEAPRNPGPPLTPLERIDIALGAAAGLAYLHGLREGEAEPGSGGGGAAAAPALPVLHRDVKSANIGLTRIGGALYAKVLDCGLARALRPLSAPGQQQSVSVSGVVGTLGYMAPELATGEYSSRSDIYALGCVLLELLSGARVGPDTAGALEARAIDEGEGVGAVAALAEACWPPPAAAALAALALACIHHSPKKRPGSMAEVLAALRVLRATVAPSAAAAPAAPLVRCPLRCEEEVAEASGLRCPAGGHFCCHGCLQEYVRSMLEVAVLRRNEGRVPCYDAGQGCSHAWTIKDLQEALDKGTHVAYSEALLHMLIDGPREASALAAAQAAAVAAAARLALGERVAALRKVIVERDLLLRCPHCAAEFDDYDGCNALTCGRCGAGFCAVCLADCGSARATHAHHKEAHGEDCYNRPLFESAKRARYLARLVEAVRGAGDATVQRALVAELGRADLRDLGISEAEVLAGAGVRAGEAPPGAGGAAAAGGARPPHAQPLAEMGECNLALRSSAFGNYLSPQPDGRMHVVPSARGPWEWLTLVPVSGQKVGLRTVHGAYLSVDPDGVIKSAPHLHAWEQFDVEAHVEDGTVSFKSVHGAYLCVERGGEGPFVVWDRQRADAWERFAYELAPREGPNGGAAAERMFHAVGGRPSQSQVLEEMGKCRLALRSSAFGSYLSPQPDGRMHAVPARGPWEWLTPVPVSGCKVGLRTVHGAYLSVDPDGVIKSAPHLHAWEQFDVEALAEDGTVSFKSVHGAYLCVERGGEGPFVVWGSLLRADARARFAYELAPREGLENGHPQGDPRCQPGP